jgi:hypothetical protein
MRIGRASNVPSNVVERIKAEHESGTSYSEIADGLTSDHVTRAQGGRRWYASTVRACCCVARDGRGSHGSSPRRDAWRSCSDT